jgi:hypothetical protein
MSVCVTGLSSRYLSQTPGSVLCHANASQSSQGTAFLTPVLAGQVAELRFHWANKPGRMRYFVGAAPRLFSVDAGQDTIQRAGYSLENLKSSPHSPGQPCAGTSPPSFHTGSTVDMKVDMRQMVISWRVTPPNGPAGAIQSVKILAKHAELHPFISLYNRGALVELEGGLV